MSSSNRRTTGGSIVQQVTSGILGRSPQLMQEFKFGDARQLGPVLADRVLMTAMKMMTVVGELHAIGVTGRPNLTIQGARFQQGGTATTGRRTAAGGLKGEQDAHYGIGTAYLNGVSIPEAVQRHRNDVVARAKLSEGAALERLGTLGDLIAIGIAYDAVTYRSPAFINQSDGKIETLLQPHLGVILPDFGLVSVAGSRRAMMTACEQTFRFFRSQKGVDLVTGIVRDRASKIRSGANKEFVQSPDDPDKKNLIFDGKESSYLVALLDTLRSDSFRGELDEREATVFEAAGTIHRIADEARSEVTAVEAAAADRT